MSIASSGSLSRANPREMVTAPRRPSSKSLSTSAPRPVGRLLVSSSHRVSTTATITRLREASCVRNRALLCWRPMSSDTSPSLTDCNDAAVIPVSSWRLNIAADQCDRLQSEAPRIYSTALPREERRLEPHREVPQWLTERVELLRRRQCGEQHDRLSLTGSALPPPSTTSSSSPWNDLLIMHQLPAVAVVVAVQLFIRYRLSQIERSDRRRKQWIAKHRLPVSDLTHDLKYTLERVVSSVEHHHLTPVPPSKKKSETSLSSDLVVSQLIRLVVPRFRERRMVYQTEAAQQSPAQLSMSSSSAVGPSQQTPKSVTKASLTYRNRKRSEMAANVDESIIKENAAYLLHGFFRLAAHRWKYMHQKLRLADSIEARIHSEHVVVLQAFLLCRNTHVVMQFKRRQKRRNDAARVVQRCFRFHVDQRRYQDRLCRLEKWHDARVLIDRQRDACRLLLRVLRVIRARTIVERRKKLLAMKCRYREDAERRQRVQELMKILHVFLTSVVLRIKRRAAITSHTEQRIKKEREQERQLLIIERVPVIQMFMQSRRSALVRQQQALRMIATLNLQLREKQLVVYRAVQDAVTRACSRRVQFVTMNFYECCPSMWVRKIRKHRVCNNNLIRELSEEASIIQAFVRYRYSQQHVQQRKATSM